jgi:anti-anti-sigma factor
VSVAVGSGYDTLPMISGPAFAFAGAIRGAYAVVRAEGELDVAAVSGLQASARAAAQRSARVVVDLRAVTFMDTSALHALAALQREADAAPDWSLHVVAGRGIQRLLDLADARAALRWMAPEQLAS